VIPEMPVTVIGVTILLIFIAVMAIATLEKMSRGLISLIGALIVYLLLTRLEGMHLSDLISFINFDVLIAVIGISIIIEVNLETGLLHYIAIKAVKLSGGDSGPLFSILALMTFILSAFTASIATIIIMGTLTISISKILRIDPTPFLLTEAILVDVGGMIFMFSSLPNLILAQEVGLSPGFFVEYVFPYAILSLSISLLFLYRSLRHTIGEADIIRKTFLMELNEWIFVKDKDTFIRSAVIFGITIIGFFVFSQELAFVALAGGVALLVLTGLPIEDVLKKVDWETVFFFAGLFIIVGGLEHEGLLEELGKVLGLYLGGNIILAALLILWIVGLLSGVIDNIPITIAFIPVILTLIKYSGLEHYAFLLWVAIIIATNVGGNLTPFGSPTTVLMIGLSKKERLSGTTKKFMRLGLRWTILNMIIGSAYIIIILIIEYLVALIGWVLVLLVILALIIIAVLLVIYVTIGIKRAINMMTLAIREISRRIK